MSAPLNPDGSRSALVRARLAAIASLGICAVAIATAPVPDVAGADPSQGYAIAAIGLAAAAILARTTGGAGTRTATAGIASLLCSAGIGVVGVALAFQEGQRQTALLYTLGGVILCLRPLMAPKSPPK